MTLNRVKDYMIDPEFVRNVNDKIEIIEEKLENSNLEIEEVKQDIEDIKKEIEELSESGSEVQQEEIDKLKKHNTNQDKEIAWLKLKQEAEDRIEGGTTFADDMNGNSFGIKFKSKKTKSNTELPAGTFELQDKVDNPSEFTVGDKVTVVDDINSELVDITRSEIVQEEGLVEVEDATVVGQAYTTSANARPVMLDNGWIVSSAVDTANKTIFLYVNKQDGGGFIQLGHRTYTSNTPVYSYVASGDYICFVYSTTQSLVCYVLDVPNFRGGIITSSSALGEKSYNIESGQTDIGSISIAISPDKTTLWAAWSSKNATYPNSFNIRASKGIIQSDGSVIWSNAEQMPNPRNTAGNDYKNPTTIVTSNGDTHIFFERDNSANNNIMQYSYNGDMWTSSTAVYTGGDYRQSNPQAVVDKNGVLLCVWHGRSNDDPDAVNIHFSESVDGGVVWSPIRRLTTGNSYTRQTPTITVNKNGEIFVLYFDYESDMMADIKRIKRENNIWGESELVIEGISASMAFPSSLYDNTFTLDFSEPLFIYQDNQNFKVGFYGSWSTVKDKFYLECTPLKNDYKKGAWLAESTMNDDGTFPMWDGSFKEIDAKDVTIINQSYSTEGNGGRKLVRLDNGWLVAAVKNTASPSFYEFEVTKDEGVSWEPLCTMEGSLAGSKRDVALASKGTMIYGVVTNGGSGGLNSWYFYFDATQYTGSESITLRVLENQNEFGNVTIAINPEGTHLHAAWACKTTAIPGTFNIHYARGVIQEDKSVVWEGGIERVTATSTTGRHMEHPSIVVKDNIPYIFYRAVGQNYKPELLGGSSYRSLLMVCKDTSIVPNQSLIKSDWGVTSLFGINTTPAQEQYSPSAIYIPSEINGLPNGRIWVAWHGVDTENTNLRARYSYSDDGGATWSGMRLAFNSTLADVFPTITSNSRGEIFLLTHIGSAGGIRGGKFNSESGFFSRSSLTSTDTATYPSALFDPTIDFSSPLFISQSDARVRFDGKWTVGEEAPLTAAVATYELPSTDYVGAFVKKSGNVNIEAYINDELMNSSLEDNEYLFDKDLSSKSPVTLRLELNRGDDSGGADDKVVRILGGIG